MSVYLDRGVVLFSDVDEKRTNATSSDLSGYQLVEVGDFVLNNQQAWRGSVGVSFYRGIVSPAYLVLRLSDELHPNFANYMFRNRDMVGHFVICSKGVGTIQRNLYWPQVKRMPVVYPDLPEQKAISNLLDQKTTQIDKTIRVKEQQITLLKERKQILIQNAVTRGLNPETPMRDSKFEWIGEIPAHWDVMANRALFAERVEPGREGLPLLSVSIHSGVSEEEVSEEENVRGRVKIADKTKYNLVRPGDIAFNMMRAWQGAIGEVRTEGMISPAYTIAMPSQKIVPKFFEYQYRTPIFIQQMDRNSKGITDFRKRLYWDGFKQLITLVPPIEEQGAIVEYIDREVAKQDRAVSLLDQQITKLKEYKATMINSAVTGKIKVPGVVEPVQGMNEPEAREVCQ
ncbi:type I restriction enzyme, S subunit [Marinobacter persicus]|uniref:Type I restriction enzyme, S subunit n=1 Tax=Marinobacter persicus TaxID=930118 RepID=A0A1I3SYV7_9GAMM|nr:hypothetical protein GCM10008110_01980 [Marinobacter persicus]SFJ63422.1 type I restriction enzyme, S subunit [Marinobacter persicus]